MSFQTFAAHATESILFAQFKAEMAGISATQIDLWLRVFAARSVA
jgi:hypothetical protein